MVMTENNLVNVSNFVQAVEAFIQHIKNNYDIHDVIIFGSHARGTQTDQSDVDIAIILKENPVIYKKNHNERVKIALDMADIAFDILLEKGILIEAFPLWQDEMEQPDYFSNPLLIQNIKREGLSLHSI